MDILKAGNSSGSNGRMSLNSSGIIGFRFLQSFLSTKVVDISLYAKHYREFLFFILWCGRYSLIPLLRCAYNNFKKVATECNKSAASTY